MTDIVLSTQNGEPVVSSRQIAENFDKRHDHVIRDIDSIKKDVPNFGEMFFETETPDSYGRPQRTYLMNRDGFTLLAMGFTGKAALEWKLKYIAAFNEMEKQLRAAPDLSALSPQLQYLIELEQRVTQQAHDITRMNQRLDLLQGMRGFAEGGWRRESARIISRITQARGGSQYTPLIYQEAYTLLEARECCSLTCRLEALRRSQMQQGVSKSKAARLGKMDAIATSPESVERWLKILQELAVKYGAGKE